MKTRYEIEQEIHEIVRQNERQAAPREHGVELRHLVEYVAAREEKWAEIVDDLRDAISFSSAINNFFRQEHFVRDFVQEVRSITTKAAAL